MRSGYLTMDTDNYKVDWKCGLGTISFKKNLVIGAHSSFIAQLKVNN